MSLGKRIKAARIQAGITQEELAEKLNLSRGTIARYELGEIEPKLQTLVYMAEYLQVSADYLMGISRHCTQISSHISHKAAKILDEFIRELREPDIEERDCL